MKILSLGDLLLDLLVRYDPALGEVDVGAGAVQLHPGGSAANFAVQAARLGAEVRFISRVGRDMPGEMLVRLLESEGVTPAVRMMDEEATGRVLVMVDRVRRGAMDGNWLPSFIPPQRILLQIFNGCWDQLLSPRDARRLKSRATHYEVCRRADWNIS